MKGQHVFLVIVVLLLAIPLGLVYSTVSGSHGITPNDEFFELSIGPVPYINRQVWHLRVEGEVENPLDLSYDEVTSMPNVTIVETLKCVSGPSGTAEWTGVPLSYVMDMANLTDDAEDIVIHAADGYSSSLNLLEANASDILLAWGMNGVTLPAEQGYPLKVVASGHYGYKWVKWITRIEVVDYDYRGYWESRGWSDDARITVSSEWGVHAYLLSIGYIFCGLAIVSGYKVEDKSEVWYYLPDFVNRRFHRVVSVLFMVILILTFAYWVSATYEARGDIFYTIHGLISILILVTFILSGASSVSKKKLGYSIHTQAALFGFLIYTLVIFLGLFIAWGSI
jgi:hypothetical protein